MKKNLFGAVAAGLALALAITSFGCESGNDDPIARLTDADLANVTGQKFVFTATPSAYKNVAGSDAERAAAGSYGSWIWENWENGTNKWNRLAGTTATLLSETKREDESHKADGKSVGSVVRTKKQTITLNAKDTTWEQSETTTNKEVYGINAFTSACDTAGTALTTYTTQKSYDAYKSVPAYKVESVGSLTNEFGVTVTGGAEPTALNISEGYSLKGLETATTGAIALAEAAKKSIDDAITALKDNPTGKKAEIEAAEKVQKQAVELIEILKAEYAANEKGLSLSKVVLEESVVDGVTTSVKTYYAGDKDLVVYTVKSSSGTAKKANSGKYKFLSGNYITGTLLITSFKQGDDVYEFFDDDDYYMKGTWRGVISVDFPVAKETTAGSINQKAGRTFSINNNVLTANAVRLTRTGATDFAYSFFLPSSITSYADAKKQAETHTGLQNNYEKSYAYSR